mgnify:CR=1 FL=1
MEIISDNHSEKFSDLLESTQDSVILVSPFIKQNMANYISRKLAHDIELIILTTFDFSSMLQKASDPEAITIFKENFSNLDIKVKEHLHAKVYIFDREKILITSANLTFSGFNSNTEYGVLINEEPHLGLILTDIERLLSDAQNLEEMAKSPSLLRKQKGYPNRDEDDLLKIIDSVKITAFNPMERSIQTDSKFGIEEPAIDVHQPENIETLQPIHVARPYKFRKNMVSKGRLGGVEYRLGDIIQFHEENDFGLIEDYKIIAAKSYKFDKQQKTYKISEVRLDEDSISTIDSRESLLRPGDIFYECWHANRRTEWATPPATFKGFIVNPNDGLQAVANFRSGMTHFMTVNKGHGPSTNFTLQPINDDDELTMFEEQLNYYYKCHQPRKN